jgi:hypothetical protein
MNNPPSRARISRRAVLQGGTLSLVAAFLGPSACGDSTSTISVKILYSTEKDAWLKQAIEVFQGKNQRYNGKLIQIVAQDSGSLDLVDQILNLSYPDLIACSPASELELNRLDYLWKNRYGRSIINYTTDLGPQSLVQSPLVFALWKEYADTLRNNYKHIDWDTVSQALQLANGWKDLRKQDRGSQIHLGQTLPTESNSGLLGITLMASAYLKQNTKTQSMLNAGAVMHNSRLWDYLNIFESHVNVYGKSSGTYWDRIIELGPAQYAIVIVISQIT